jgi:hypothetical protein
MLLRCVSGAVPGRGEKPKRFFARVSHYNLQARGLTRLDGIDAASGARVLYLYDNALRSLAPLSRLRALAQVYAENNELEEVDVCGGGVSAAPLVSLEKLFLGGNRIARVSGAAAAALPRLAELHLADQRLGGGGGGGGGALVLERAALRGAWSRGLRVLDVSGCGLRALAPLAALRALRDLRAARNPAAALDDAAALLLASPALERLDVRGCAFATAAAPAGAHRDVLTAAAGAALEWLDGRDVTPAHKAFMREKHARATARAAKIAAALYALRRAQRAAAAGAAGAPDADARAAADDDVDDADDDQDALDGAFAGAGADDDADDAGAGAGVRLADAAAAAAAAARAAAEPIDELADFVALGEAAGGGLDDAALDSPVEGETRGDEAVAGAGAAASLAETLVPAQAAAVRRASAAGAEAAGDAGAGAPPPPPLPPTHRPAAGLARARAAAAAPPPSPSPAPIVGSLDGFRSLALDPPLPLVEAQSPRRSPSDLAPHSRFAGGFALPSDRERARMHREHERARELAQRMAGGVRNSPR